jgi:hypothetical protein
MKKLLFILVLGFGGAMLFKSGQVTATTDRHIQVAGYQVPLPEAVQNSPVYGMVIEQLPQAASKVAASPGAPVRPLMPIVSSANGSFNANTSGSASAARGGPATGADGFSAAAKALRGPQ